MSCGSGDKGELVGVKGKKYFAEKIKKSIPKKLSYEITTGKAKKRRITIDGFIRNSKVKNLKELYENKCQISQCNFKLKYVNKNNYKHPTFSFHGQRSP